MLVVYSSENLPSSLGANEIETAIKHGLAILPFEFDATGFAKQHEGWHWLDSFDEKLLEHFKLLGLKIKKLLELGGIEDSHDFTPDGRLITKEEEELCSRSLEVIRQENRASQPLIQRRLKLGYSRAARIMDILEARGIVGGADGPNDREILVKLDDEEGE